MSPWKYQVLHPWHWLTYGQNAAALQALCAVLGAFGLFIYVLDTSRMRRISEATRRASITPVFTAREILPRYANTADNEGLYQIDVMVRNVGEGPATVFWAWYQPVSSDFSVFNASILKQPKHVKQGEVMSGDLMKGESTAISFPAYSAANPDSPFAYFFEEGSKWLFVVDSIDQAQGRHQLKMTINIAKGKAPGEANMAHTLGDTFGERIVKLVSRTVEIGLAIRGQIARLFR